MVSVGLPCSFTELSSMDEIQGGTPYGASCVAGAQARMPTARKIQLCRYQGSHVAKFTDQFRRGATLAG